MLTIVRYGKKLTPETGKVRFFFQAPEYAETRKSGYIDMSSEVLHQALLVGGRWSPYCVKAKKGANALVVAVAHNPYVAPLTKELEEIFAASHNYACKVSLHHTLTVEEMNAIEQLPCLQRKKCLTRPVETSAMTPQQAVREAQRYPHQPTADILPNMRLQDLLAGEASGEALRRALGPTEPCEPDVSPLRRARLRRRAYHLIR